MEQNSHLTKKYQLINRAAQRHLDLSLLNEFKNSQDQIKQFGLNSDCPNRILMPWHTKGIVYR